MSKTEFRWDSNYKRLVRRDYEYQPVEKYDVTVQHVWDETLKKLVPKEPVADGGKPRQSVVKKAPEIKGARPAVAMKKWRPQTEGIPHWRLTDDHWCRSGQQLISNQMWHNRQATKDARGVRPLACKYNL